jgi:GntR family transcriptional regulator, transcriptional repressor for pyruvate dehydrogenase complex
MPAGISTQKIAEAIADHLEKLILEGVLRPGEKLATERELAEKLDVSRPSLRDALGKLQTKGLIKTTKTGTVVAQFLAPLSKPLAELFADNPRVTADYFEYRRIIEGQAASLAATRATDMDRAALKECCERIRKAHEIDDPSEEAGADADLHLLVYEAAHNVVLLHVMRVFSELLRNGILYNRNQLYGRYGVRDRLLEQHVAIADAIQCGDPKAAEKAASDHIQFTFQSLEEIRRDKLRLETSLSRVGRNEFLAR